MKLTELKKRIERFNTLHTEQAKLQNEIATDDAEHARNRAQALMSGDSGKPAKNFADAKRARLEELAAVIPEAKRILEQSAAECRDVVCGLLKPIQDEAASVVDKKRSIITAEMTKLNEQLMDLDEGPARELSYLTEESIALLQETSPSSIANRIDSIAETYGLALQILEEK